MSVTFFVLGLTFYQMSGGTAFEPQVHSAVLAATVPAKNTANSHPPARTVLEVNKVVTVRQTPQNVSERPSENAATTIKVSALSPTTAPRVQPVALSAALGEVVSTRDTLPAGGASLEPQKPAVLVVETLPTVQEQKETDDTAEAVVATVLSNDIRRVTAERVNFRAGPGTNFGIIGKLVSGDVTYVLEDNGAGWVRVETQDDTVGWLADFLLGDS